MKPLNAIDQLFFHDDDRNLSNSTLVLSFTKFEFEPFNDYLLKGFSDLPFRSKIVDYFGNHYFKTLSKEEFAECWKKVSVNVEHIHTQDEL